MDITSEKRREISFHFHPAGFETGSHVIEKSEGEGKPKKKYLKGVSSGVKLDGHEERMTQKAIDGFMTQANSGQVLLYPDAHGIRASDDIGILSSASVAKNGDWETEYRLYDKDDDIGPQKAEKIETIWKQLTGQPPYKKPLQKGFSIEGYIPPEGILDAEIDKASGAARRRVIDKVDLDGVVLVPRPAYKDSVAHACYKALGELAPHQREKVQKGVHDVLRQKIKDQELQDQYYRKRWEVQEALDEEVEKIMKGPVNYRQESLCIAFKEYTDILSELIMNSASLFQPRAGGENETRPLASGAVSKSELFQALKSQVIELAKIMTSGGKE